MRAFGEEMVDSRDIQPVLGGIDFINNPAGGAAAMTLSVIGNFLQAGASIKGGGPAKARRSQPWREGC